MKRLILDCRRLNRLFRPPTILLGSVEALSKIRLSPDAEEQMFVAQEDVRDYFYRLYLPRGLAEWFSLDEVDLPIL